MGYVAYFFLLGAYFYFWPFSHYKLLNLILSYYFIPLFYYFIFP